MGVGNPQVSLKEKYGIMHLILINYVHVQSSGVNGWMSSC